jgi:hypothetical protein
LPDEIQLQLDLYTRVKDGQLQFVESAREHPEIATKQLLKLCKALARACDTRARILEQYWL